MVALAIDGKMLDSEELASRMEQWNVNGISHVAFVIGGSLGLAPTVLKRATISSVFQK